MSSLTKTWAYPSNAETWTFSSGGGGSSGSWQNTDGDPAAGYLRVTQSGGPAGTGMWYFGGTWESIGVPAGSVINSVELSAKDKVISHTSGAAATLGPYALSTAAAFGGTDTTLIAARTGATAAEGSWTTRTTSGPVAVPAALDASSDTFYLKIRTGISPTKTVGYDTVELTVDFTPGPVGADLDVTLGGVAAAFVAKAGVYAGLSATLADVTASLAAHAPDPFFASLSATLADVTASLAAEANTPPAATLSATLGDVTASLSGHFGGPSAATLDATLADVTAVLVGNSGTGNAAADLDADLGDVAAALAVHHVPPPASVANLIASISAVTASLTGHGAIPGLTLAGVAVTLDAVTAALDATWTPGDTDATLAATLGDVTAALTVELVNPVAATLDADLGDVVAAFAAHTPYVAVLRYRVYGNAGGGPADPIDYTAPLAEIGGLTADVGPLDFPAHYLFTVRAYDAASGLEESNVDAITRLVLDADGLDVTSRPNAPADVHATDRGGGSVRVSWTYNPFGQGGAPVTFKVWATEQVGGGGTPGVLLTRGLGLGSSSALLTGGLGFAGSGVAGVDYGADPVATVTYSPGTVIYAATLALDAGSDYAIGVRATNATGDEPNTTATATVTPADTGPDPVTSLVAAAT